MVWQVLPDVLQGVVDCAGFRAALVPIEIGLQLLAGFVGVEKEFLARAEGQAADVAIGGAGRGADKPYDPHIAVGHQANDCRGKPWRQIPTVLFRK